MKEQILELRAQGKSYNEIKEIVGCSKGTISYHCGEGQKEKNNNRKKVNRLEPEGIVRQKVERFLNEKLKDFKRGKSYLPTNSSIVYKEAIALIKNNPYCYLTGRKLNLEDRKSYSLDHIIPLSKGGSNELDNMGLTCRDANQSKWELSVEDYLTLCKEVLENNGYKVEKI
jgi:5-methylcytosine-specific restriction endonuclease McrA